MRTSHVVTLVVPLVAAALFWYGLGALNTLPPAEAVRSAPAARAPEAPAGASSGVAITLTAAGFQPAVLTVTAPATVTWYNATTQTVLIHSGTPTFVYLPIVVKNANGAIQATRPSATAPQNVPQPGHGSPTRPATADYFSVTLGPGSTFTYVLQSAGTVSYYALAAQTFHGQVTVKPGIPPDPSTIAPPLDMSVATSMYSATQFLYSGPNPIQTGVAPGTIDPQHVTVMRGRVLDRSGQPLPGAIISILNHPEYGQTLSRADGMFDLAANGGGLFTIQYSAPGFLPSQRQLTTPWRQFGRLPDVVLIPTDPQVSTVDLTSNAIQIARASIITDSDGIRQETLLFPVSTTAWLTLPNGVTQTLSTLHVRSTEYTVGPTGPDAMPGQLPPSSAYTYATEFSADEVSSAGGHGPSFSQPVIAYNENFLTFPVGITIPAGYYDPVRTAWIPMPNGRVLKILSDTNGMANLDLTGSGIPANAAALAALGISDAERGTLANLYPVGSSLWRFTTTHFSSFDPGLVPTSRVSDFDGNMGITCLGNDCVPPNEPPPQLPPPFCPASQSGSIIECQSQALGENLPVVGTDYSLIYRSDLEPGRKAEYGLNIPLSGSQLPTGLLTISLQINVAGRSFASIYPSASNQTASFQWDGKDAYGRQMQGSQPVEVRLGYVYHLVYGPCAFLGGGCGGTVGYNTARMEFTLYQVWNTSIGAWNATPLGLGGWGLDIHHSYDPFSKVLYMGDGGRRDTSALDIDSISTVAGVGNTFYLGDGGPAGQAGVKQPGAVAVAPDGTYYIAETGRNRVRRVDSSGIITTVAGTGSNGYSGDGGPATAAQLFGPGGVTLGPDGSLFIADTFNNRIRRVSPDGIISTVAGNGTYGFGGDGGPATQAKLGQPNGVKIAPDGTLYIADTGNQRIRRVGADGLISTAAGKGLGFAGDGGSATNALLADPSDVAIAPDGTLYISDYFNFRIRHVDATGIITTVAGGGVCGSPYCGDGGPATQAALSRVWGINFGPDGALYIADHDNGRIRRLGTDGIISTVAGGGTDPAGYGGDGGPATLASLNSPEGVSVSPDGMLYIADEGNWRIRIVKPVLPQFTLGNIYVPSDDGSEVYIFDAGGRHLRTLDALTGATVYQFGYNAARQLATITDRAGNVTTIQHDSSGHPSAIVGPYGQVTALTVDANGFLSSIANPANESTQLASTPDGMLTALTDPRGNIHHFTYDVLGRLASDQNPAGGTSTLVRTGATRAYTVTFDTPLSRTTNYETDFIPGGGQKQVNTAPNGLKSQTTWRSDGSTANLFANGIKTIATSGPDPRWGLAGSIRANSTFTTADGLTSAIFQTRSVALADNTNLFSLVALTNTWGINNRAYNSTYDAVNRIATATSPSGRQTVDTLDALGRLVLRQEAGIAPVTYGYDGRGRLSTVSMGSGPGARTYNLGYDSASYLMTVTDPLGRTFNQSHDATGRVLSQTLPGAQVVAYSYDANANLTALTPPGQPVHSFGYTPLNLVSVYTAPVASGATNPTLYSYNLDRQLTQIVRPDGQPVNVSYDPAGRVSGISIARGAFNYAYDGATGNLAAIGAPGGISLSYSYDGMLLTGQSWTGPVSGSVGIGYNGDYRRLMDNVNGSFTTTYQYDQDSLLTQAGGLTLSRSTQNRLVNGSTLGNVVETQGYDGFGETISNSVSVSNAVLIARQYGYDKLGRITVLTETLGMTANVYTYTYDLAGHLGAAGVDGTAHSEYTNDGNGNRLSSTTAGGTISGTYDAQDRLITFGSNSYAYTANGELLTKAEVSGTTTYQYDAPGNLISVTLPAGTQIMYLTDGQNRRIGKQVNGIPVQGFLYEDQLRPVAELDGSNNVVSVFVYADRAGGPAYMVKGGVSYRVIVDHLGSPRLIVNAVSGQIVQRMDYDEFGRVLTDTNPGFQPFGFAGGLYDRDTGLMRFGARDYDAQVGRWTAKDPAGFFGGQTNLYAYVANDPVNRTDMTGMAGGGQCTANCGVEQTPGGSLETSDVAAIYAGTSAISYFSYALGAGQSAATALGQSVAGLEGLTGMSWLESDAIRSAATALADETAATAAAGGSIAVGAAAAGGVAIGTGLDYLFTNHVGQHGVSLGECLYNALHPDEQLPAYDPTKMR